VYRDDFTELNLPRILCLKTSECGGHIRYRLRNDAGGNIPIEGVLIGGHTVLLARLDTLSDMVGIAGDVPEMDVTLVRGACRIKTLH
jgi:hypothetical protein